MANVSVIRRLTFSVLAFALLSCGPSIPIRFPQFPDATGDQLRGVIGGQKNVGVIAARPQAGALSGLGRGEEDWSDTVEGAVTTEVAKRGFYNIVDVSSRKERLRELAYTQSGMTRDALRIGEELSVNLLLVVRMTRQPRMECKIERLTDYAAAAANLMATAAGSNSQPQETKKDTAVLYMTVFAQGVLTNVETARSVTYANSKPFKLEASVGDTNCPSALAGFDGALQIAASEIADHLSPTVVTVRVPLLEEADEVPDANSKARVEGWLSQGNEWAESANFDEAAKSWRRALNDSDGESVSAMWNLAVYSWYSGDYDEAERYFEKALENGGPSWLNGAKRELISRFREQKRLAEGAER